MRVLGLSGSLRQASYNTMLLAESARLLSADDALVIYNRLGEIPPYDEDQQADRPDAVTRLAMAIADADAVLVATPEYNSSIPGHLKNALDWMSRPLATSPLRFKPAAVVGASTGIFGAVWAQAETRKVLAAIGARVVAREVAVASADEALRDGRLHDPSTLQELASLLAELTAAVRERQEASASA